MEFIEMLQIIEKVNKKSKNPVDNKLLEQILALVIKNPLDEDRALCQDQIQELIKQRRK
jgi:hypothetical protein